jgi:outer membrane protein OmpA-like peptidoglycan-associated protein
MKTLTKAVPLVLATAIASQTTQASTSKSETAHDPKQAIAVVSSGIIGGLLGGPVGFFVAAVGADLLVDAESSRDEGLQNAANEEMPEAIEPALTLATDLSAAKPLTESIELLSSEVVESDLVAEKGKIEMVIMPVDSSSNELMSPRPEADPKIKMADLAVSLLFASSQSSLNESMHVQILNLSRALKEYPNALIQVDGHADPRGDSEFNLDLSQRRANAVANALVEQGIDRARIVVRSFGETKSSSSEYDYVAHRAERNVDIKISPMLSENIVQTDIDTPVAQIK